MLQPLAGALYEYGERSTMSKAVIDGGICGFRTEVVAHLDGDGCALDIQSDCPSIKALALELHRVDPMREISFRGEGPLTLAIAKTHCPHPACPVPAGIIKAIEVAAGLALPKGAHIEVSDSPEP